jgi:hypothetical protein
MTTTENTAAAAPAKGLIALIYRDSLGIDYSNHGISSTATEVVVVGPGIDPIFEASEERPAVRIESREWLGNVTYHAVLITDEPGTWWMYGGTFIFSSDSRFRATIPFSGAVALHDRRE